MAWRPLQVFTVSQRKQPIRTAHGVRVHADYSFADAPPIDVLIVPGGGGAEKEVDNAPLIDWIRAKAREAEHVASVCTGAFLLAKAGLVEGIPVTTHHWAAKRLQETFPGTTVVLDQRFVERGKISSAGGISAGIDLSFHLLQKLATPEDIAWVREFMEYGDWKRAR